MSAGLAIVARVLFALAHGVLDLERRVLVVAGASPTEVRLTTTEARLLSHLARHPERAFGRDELQVEVWGYRSGISTRTVFTTVGRIRQKIEPEPSSPRYLVSEGGRYRFCAPQAARAAARPEPATPFIGRARELSELQRLLASGARLVSLLGPGGIGKTRLALELARRLPGPTTFVALEAASSTSELARAVFAAAGLRPLSEGEEDASGLIDRLREREQVLVLDNVEQIPGAASLLGSIAASCPRLQLIVTSRVRLNLAAETALVVEPLAEPRGDDLGSSEAGQFLLEHARRARPGWEPGPEEQGHLARVCGLTEGSPLAMELACSWLRLLEPRELVAELERGGALLEARRPDVPARHASVRATLEASFRLLAPESVRALAALAVLRSPFAREAAKAVADADLRELGQLVDASMIRRAGGGRFVFHPAVREEALARLGDPERAARLERHGRYFLDRLASTYAEVDAGRMGERTWLELVDAEQLDVVAAFREAAARGDHRSLARAAEPLYRYFDGRNRYAELAAEWSAAKVALRAAPATPERTAALGLLVALEQGAGWGVREATTAPEALRPLGDEAVTTGLVGATIEALVAERAADAAALGREAVALARRTNRQFQLGYALSVHASSLARAGDLPGAAALLEEAVARFGQRGGRTACRPMVHLGEVRLFMGEAGRARELLERALAACRDAEDRAFAMLGASRLGEAVAALGGDPSAIWTEALEEACEHHVPPYWWGPALVGLASARLAAPEARGAALRALGCARRLLVSAVERAAIERHVERGRSLEPAAEAWLRAGEALDPEEAALTLLSA